MDWTIGFVAPKIKAPLSSEQKTLAKSLSLMLHFHCFIVILPLSTIFSSEILNNLYFLLVFLVHNLPCDIIPN